MRRVFRIFEEAEVLDIAAAIVVALAFLDLLKTLAEPPFDGEELAFRVGDRIVDLGPLVASGLTFVLAVGICALVLRRVAR